MATVGDTEAKSCNTCPNGFYSDIEGLTTCKTCGLGWRRKTGSGHVSMNNACERCPQGQYNDATMGSGSERMCNTCPSYYYTDQIGQSKCKGCLSWSVYGGWTNKEVGATDCDACSPGFYNYKGLGKPVHCTECSKGKYQSQTGQSYCKFCPKGWFQEYTQQSLCKACKDYPRYQTNGGRIDHDTSSSPPTTVSPDKECLDCPSFWYNLPKKSLVSIEDNSRSKTLKGISLANYHDWAPSGGGGTWIMDTCLRCTPKMTGFTNGNGRLLCSEKFLTSSSINVWIESTNKDYTEKKFDLVPTSNVDDCTDFELDMGHKWIGPKEEMVLVPCRNGKISVTTSSSFTKMHITPYFMNVETHDNRNLLAGHYLSKFDTHPSVKMVFQVAQDIEKVELILDNLRNGDQSANIWEEQKWWTKERCSLESPLYDWEVLEGPNYWVNLQALAQKIQHPRLIPTLYEHFELKISFLVGSTKVIRMYRSLDLEEVFSTKISTIPRTIEYKNKGTKQWSLTNQPTKLSRPSGATWAITSGERDGVDGSNTLSQLPHRLGFGIVYKNDKITTGNYVMTSVTELTLWIRRIREKRLTRVQRLGGQGPPTYSYHYKHDLSSCTYGDLLYMGSMWNPSQTFQLPSKERSPLTLEEMKSLTYGVKMPHIDDDDPELKCSESYFQKDLINPSRTRTGLNLQMERNRTFLSTGSNGFNLFGASLTSGISEIKIIDSEEWVYRPLKHWVTVPEIEDHCTSANGGIFDQKCQRIGGGRNPLAVGTCEQKDPFSLTVINIARDALNVEILGISPINSLRDGKRWEDCLPCRDTLSRCNAICDQFAGKICPGSKDIKFTFSNPVKIQRVVLQGVSSATTTVSVCGNTQTFTVGHRVTASFTCLSSSLHNEFVLKIPSLCLSEIELYGDRLPSRYWKQESGLLRFKNWGLEEQTCQSLCDNLKNCLSYTCDVDRGIFIPYKHNCVEDLARKNAISNEDELLFLKSGQSFISIHLFLKGRGIPYEKKKLGTEWVVMPNRFADSSIFDPKSLENEYSTTPTIQIKYFHTHPLYSYNTYLATESILKVPSSSNGFTLSLEFKQLTNPTGNQHLILLSLELGYECLSIFVTKKDNQWTLLFKLAREQKEFPLVVNQFSSIFFSCGLFQCFFYVDKEPGFKLPYSGRFYTPFSIHFRKNVCGNRASSERPFDGIIQKVASYLVVLSEKDIDYLLTTEDIYIPKISGDHQCFCVHQEVCGSLGPTGSNIEVFAKTEQDKNQIPCVLEGTNKFKTKPNPSGGEVVRFNCLKGGKKRSLSFTKNQPGILSFLSFGLQQRIPTPQPTPTPIVATKFPTAATGPTPKPTPYPTNTRQPSPPPTSRAPTKSPTKRPSYTPSLFPTPEPTDSPTHSPTKSPLPTFPPTFSPTKKPVTIEETYLFDLVYQGKEDDLVVCSSLEKALQKKFGPFSQVKIEKFDTKTLEINVVATSTEHQKISPQQIIMVLKECLGPEKKGLLTSVELRSTFPWMEVGLTLIVVGVLGGLYVSGALKPLIGQRYRYHPVASK